MLTEQLCFTYRVEHAGIYRQKDIFHHYDTISIHIILQLIHPLQYPIVSQKAIHYLCYTRISQNV